MTAKESARQIATKYRWPKPPSDTLVEMIESAITAAVEEARAEEATRSLIEIDRAVKVAADAAAEEERGSCAEILEVEAARYGAGFPGPTERKIEELLLILAIKIRARSEEKGRE